MARPFVNVYEGEPERLVFREMNDVEYAQWQADVARAEPENAARVAADLNRPALLDQVRNMLAQARAAADGFDANTLTPAQQRAAIAGNLRITIKLARIVLNLFDDVN